MKKISFALISVATIISLTVACNKKDSNNAITPNNYATTPQACNVIGNPNQQQYQQPYQQQYPQYGNYNNGYYGGMNYWYGGGYNSGYNSGYNNVPYQNTYYCNNNLYGNYNNTNVNWYYGQWYWPTQWQASQTNCGCPVGYISVYAAQYGVACAPATYGSSMSLVYYNVNWYWGAAQNTYQLNTPQVQYVGPSSSCQTSAQGCDTRYNNCPGGSYCQAAGGGSSIGICVQQY